MGELISSAQDQSQPQSQSGEGKIGEGGKEEKEGKFSLSKKMQALLEIAGAVTRSGKDVTAQMVETAKGEGASDMDVHDTVMIAAAFCMFNRYVDGLGTGMPGDEGVFGMRGEEIRRVGYVGVLKGMGRGE